MKKICKILIFLIIITIITTNYTFADTSDDTVETKLTYNSYITKNGNEMTITMEAYATSYPNFTTSLEIPASDIIVLFDQSQVMSEDRDAIISTVKNLVGDIVEPTYDSAGSDTPAHRVAIAGYGRIGLNLARSKYK